MRLAIKLGRPEPVARMIASASMSIAAITACSASSEYGGRRSREGSRPAVATCGDGAKEESTSELDIFPGGTLPRWIPQKRCRMIGGHERNAVVLMDGLAELAHRQLCVK